MTGYVLRLFHDKGYGFIRGEDGLSRFMHCKDVFPPVDFDRLKEGGMVEFEPLDMGENNPAMRRGNGLRAGKVRIKES